MAKATPRNYCKLDVMVWNHSGMRKLSDSAALAYIYLIAWSKCMKRDGDFDGFSLQQCGADGDDLQQLLDGGFVTVKEGQPDTYNIPKFEGWQVTMGEEEHKQEVSRVNGAKGGRAPSVPRDEREVWLKIASGAWPEPGPGYRHENGDNVRKAFYDNVVTEADWDRFQKVLLRRIGDYEADTRPKDAKRPFLGSLQKFCAAWRDEIEETDERPVAAVVVVKKEMPAFKMHVDAGEE